jgi:flagellar protein FlbT
VAAGRRAGLSFDSPWISDYTETDGRLGTLSSKAGNHRSSARRQTMALKLTLKPGEKMIIGGAVVRNGVSKAELFIENKVPLLREKDIMGEKDARTVAERIYFTVQLMYIDQESLVDHHNAYWHYVGQLTKAAPSSIALVDQISEKIVSNQYYQALKLSRKLMDYEKEIMSRV